LESACRLSPVCAFVRVFSVFSAFLAAFAFFLPVFRCLGEHAADRVLVLGKVDRPPHRR
jgi:hypothetical protein